MVEVDADDGRGKDWYASFGAATKVTSIEPLIRLAVQQSNCFVITSIGNNRTESKLSDITDKQRNSGEFRAGSKQQKGQRVAADYYLEPAIIVDNDSTGRMGASLGGLLGRGNPLLGAPNLADNVWLHGGGEDAVVRMVTEGKLNVMPAHKDRFSEAQIRILAGYVWSLSQPAIATAAATAAPR